MCLIIFRFLCRNYPCVFWIDIETWLQGLPLCSKSLHEELNFVWLHYPYWTVVIMLIYRYHYSLVNQLFISSGNGVLIYLPNMLITLLNVPFDCHRKAIANGLVVLHGAAYNSRYILTIPNLCHCQPAFCPYSATAIDITPSVNDYDCPIIFVSIN